VASCILERRAVDLINRIEAFLPGDCSVLDIGCGTGHNVAALLRQFPSLRCTEADVTNMKMIGTPPVLIESNHLQFPDNSFDVGLLLFVLHYPAEPMILLREARRVISRRLIVLQSTFQGARSRCVLAGREWMQGRGIFRVARMLGLVGGSGASLKPARLFDSQTLRQLFADAGWRVTHHQPQYWPLTRVSRGLYVLEKS